LREFLVLAKGDFKRLTHDVITVAVEVLAVQGEFLQQAGFDLGFEPLSGELGLLWDVCHSNLHSLDAISVGGSDPRAPGGCEWVLVRRRTPAAQNRGRSRPRPYFRRTPFSLGLGESVDFL